MLIAIDGTGSRDWRDAGGSNSHVARFVLAYRGKKPRLGQTHGPDTLGLKVPAIQADMIGMAMAGHANGEREFDIVGHSRGGHIAIMVAKALLTTHLEGVRVRFLGLFDAVDRAPTGQWSTSIPPQVEACRHAVRHPMTLNRTWFGNTGRIGSAPQYKEKIFWASHGAIGGDPAKSWSFGGIAGANTLLTPPRVDEVGANAVWTWMRQEAVACGVPIG